ncbi:MAG: sarcosine oxidase subunit delta [Hyphomicrobiaceae bacterium]|nr:sarcosine oxidase subunit delta [Hyphomicrobiaceae bacterium]
MLLIRCPYCEEDRPEVEFRYAGEAHVARSLQPSAESDADWAQYLYIRSSPKGWHRERWHHVHGCGRFLNALRHTVSDRIAATYAVGAALPEPPAPAQGGKADA